MGKSRAYGYWTGTINNVGSSRVEYVNTLDGFNCAVCGRWVLKDDIHACMFTYRGVKESSDTSSRDLANVIDEILWLQDQLKEATENLVKILKNDS